MKTALIIISILAAVAIGFAIYFAVKKKEQPARTVESVATVVPIPNPISAIEAAKYRAAVGADVI